MQDARRKTQKTKITKKIKKGRQKKMGKSSQNRDYYYATLVYPDSAPDNWMDILKESKLQIFISPLHDKDVFEDTGEIKKPHYHVMIMYDNQKAHSNAKKFIESFRGVGFEVLNGKRGMARYLCHMDNPDKYRYSEDDVIALGGADYMSACKTTTDKLNSKRAILRYVRMNPDMTFCDVVDYAVENQPDWIDVLFSSGGNLIFRYMQCRKSDF